jgi:uncharacterized DUF497 family protein
MDEGATDLALRAFEWDAEKSESNRAKHSIEFEDAIDIFYAPILLRRSDRNNEERWVAIGSLDEKLIAVVFARRKDVIRIISARRARKNEERAYRNASMGRSAQGKN